ncbi:hypothetical protein [Amycolatopsis sp. FDAARGOS 1241]|uniref:hypothetical protein n=1 Tax=Amycolatopsis sp. FDAARGOS 1241 TaxID=2778070 RepID=UPI00194E254F|nr:hypothetical protein [Amycolatopsis sp. FDAARGOS 1241]QRP46898.1 hypothetical protein I6J71_02265 [Amycolatopsis sp. FDAARGOS 1241]
MSMPEPQNTSQLDTTTGPLVGTTSQLPTRGATASGPTRTVRTAVWAGCHLGELAGVSVPLVLTFTASEWFAPLSGLVALLWALHACREFRAGRATNRTGGEGR